MRFIYDVRSVKTVLSDTINYARTRALAQAVRVHQLAVGSDIRVHDIDLTVDPGVLSPADAFGFGPSHFLAMHSGVRLNERVLDMGTGSGLLAILAARKGADVVAVDIAEAAVRCARRNAERHQLRIDVRQGDLFDSVSGMTFDRILFNAPFHFGEPQDAFERALFGGQQGGVLRRFFSDVRPHLRPNGVARIAIASPEAAKLIPSVIQTNGIDMRLIARSPLIPLMGRVHIYEMDARGG